MANVGALKSENLARLFAALRKEPRSRVQLARETGLSKSAVTMLTAALIAEGQLVETGATDVGGHGVFEAAVGRRPIALDIAAGYRAAVGVYLHRRHIAVSLTDLKLSLLDTARVPTEQFAGADAEGGATAAADWIAGTARGLIEKHGYSGRVIGAGVSSPGPLDYKQGRILTPPDFEMFHGVPISRWLTERLHMPVLLDNNAVLLAMTEYYRGEMNQYRNALFVTIADGVGSCLLTGGQIFRGFGGHAGELGHLSIDKNGLPCPCGNRGCLEQYVTLAALQKRFGFTAWDAVVDAAYTGDAGATAVLDDAAANLSCALISAVNLFDLDLIVLFGELCYRPQLLLDKLAARIKDGSLIENTHPVAVRASLLPADAMAMSSAAGIVEAYFGQTLGAAQG